MHIGMQPLCSKSASTIAAAIAQVWVNLSDIMGCVLVCIECHWQCSCSALQWITLWPVSSISCVPLKPLQLAFSSVEAKTNPPPCLCTHKQVLVCQLFLHFLLGSSGIQVLKSPSPKIILISNKSVTLYSVKKNCIFSILQTTCSSFYCQKMASSAPAV